MDKRSMAFEGLRQGLMDARRQTVELDADLKARAGTGPRPGDLYVLGDSSEPGVEWAVLEPQGEDLDLFLVVPADPRRLTGTGDVWVPETAAGGPLTLRCRYGAWIPTPAFLAGQRSGFLDAQTVREARDIWTHVGAGTGNPTLEQQETDADPEYGFWAEDVLRPARDRLVNESRHRRDSNRWPRGLYGLAATMVLVASLALCVGVLWQQQRLASGDRERAHLTERLASVEAELEQAQQALADSAQDGAQAEDKVESAGASGVRVNPPTVVLQTGDVDRGSEGELRVSSEDEFFQLEVIVEDPSVLYRLKIIRARTQDVIWEGHSLEPNRWSELILNVPLQLMPPGDYRLQLDAGGVAGGLERVGTYTLKVLLQ